MYEPMRVCKRLHMDLHVGTWTSAHVSAAAVARGDVHGCTHLHTHRCAYACGVVTSTMCSMHSTLTAPGRFACTQAHGACVQAFCLSMCALGKVRQGGLAGEDLAP